MAARKKAGAKPTGRKTIIGERVRILDPETKERRTMIRSEAIVELLRRGAYIEDAAAATGIHPSTVHDWIARGEEHRGSASIPARERPFAEFAEAVETARAEAVTVALDVIRTAARDGQWQAAAWYLERTRPGKYSRSERREVSGPGGGPITLLDLERELAEEASE